MNWLDEDPLAQLFESLGYEVTWDGTMAGERWYEVLKDGALFVQIDIGISLEHLQWDFADDLAGREMSSPFEGTISGPRSPELTGFMEAIVAYKGAEQ